MLFLLSISILYNVIQFSFSVLISIASPTILLQVQKFSFCDKKGDRWEEEEMRQQSMSF